ncbi:putative calcium-binding protein CML13 [Drosera capensis]
MRFVGVKDLRHTIMSIGARIEPKEFDEWIREVMFGADWRIGHEEVTFGYLIKFRVQGSYLH